MARFFAWAVAACPAAPFMLKTDEDAFVHVGALVERLAGLPRARLLLGYGLSRMAAVDKAGRPKHGNRHAYLTHWPPYMSGAGYVVTRDVARVLGDPPLPHAWLQDEDVATGLRLYPYNVTFVSDPRAFKPWGHCEQPGVILIHYQRSAPVMRRRYARALRGESICGQPFAAGGPLVCGEGDEGHTLRLRCPPGTAVAEVVHASYGLRDGECAEGRDGLTASSLCHAPVSAAAVAERCLGRATCDVLASNTRFGGDPCPLRPKHLHVVVRCGPPASS